MRNYSPERKGKRKKNRERQSPRKKDKRKRETGEKRKKEEEEMADHAKKTHYRAKVICEKKRKGKQKKIGVKSGATEQAGLYKTFRRRNFTHHA